MSSVASYLFVREQTANIFHMKVLQEIAVDLINKTFTLPEGEKGEQKKTERERERVKQCYCNTRNKSGKISEIITFSMHLFNRFHVLLELQLYHWEALVRI